MNTSERRTKILNIISESTLPVSGAALAEKCGVSRQIIVSDVGALKKEHNIIATNRGYILQKPQMYERTVKTFHTDEETEDELFTIVRNGGIARNVFVWHKIYGKIEAPLNIATELDVTEYMKSLKSGRSKPLKKVTCEYHYHIIEAQSEEILDNVEKSLERKGYLVKEL